jgi:hypothetical protein
MTTTQERVAELVRTSTAAYPTGFYGVVVTELGDDGRLVVAAGHVEPRRMAAACNAYTRHLTGERLRWDSPTPLLDVLGQIKHVKAALLEPFCDDYARSHGEPDHECPATYDWGLDWNEDTPGRDVELTVLDRQ